MEKNMKEKIVELIKHLSAFEKLRSFRTVTAQMFGGPDEKEKAKDKREGTPVLEGISFRFKTVQFHLIDDCFEEIKKRPETFGDVEIYSERFSLPGWGDEEAGVLSRDEYQFEITALIKSKTGQDKDTYFKELEDVMKIISDKHDVDIDITPTEKYYNVNYIIFHTSKEGVFSKE
jgi:hypothetical protein